MKIYSPNEYVSGKSFFEWTSKYWQWILAIPSHENPYYGGGDLSLNQQGPVYFSTNAPENSTVSRSVHVQFGKNILIPLNTSVFTTLDGSDFSTIQKLADIQEGDVVEIRIMTGDSELSSTLSNQGPNWWKSYRVKSQIFEFTIPGKNILEIQTSQHLTKGYGFSDGY
jgi:hypothetical protein